MVPTETCQHCGREIGPREPAHVFRQQIVCDACSSWLRASAAAAAIANAAPKAARVASGSSSSPENVRSSASAKSDPALALTGFMMLMAAPKPRTRPAPAAGPFKSSICIRVPAPVAAPIPAAPSPQPPPAQPGDVIVTPGRATPARQLAVATAVATRVATRSVPPASYLSTPARDSSAAADARRAQTSADPSLGVFAEAPSAEEVLVRLGDVTVTTRVVESLRWGRLPVSRVVSIRPSRSIVLGAAVDVRDADGESRRYKFSTADAARKFIVALRRANPSVPVEDDEHGPACVVWSRGG